MENTESIAAQDPQIPATGPDAGPLVWTDPVSAKHAVRVICDLEGLPVTPTFNVNGTLYLLKDVLCACVQVESAFLIDAVHFNRDPRGNVISTDYGICQINDYWNIGPNKPFSSSQYVLANPQECVEWMAKKFLAGQQTLWASFTSGLYKKYLPVIAPKVEPQSQAS